MEPGSPVPQTSDAGTVLTASVDRPLPPQPTRLIDREEELTRINSLLAAEEIQLLTLTGPGGVGKTRVAVAAAERVLERVPGGVWFVDLTPLADPALVVPTIARVVGVRERSGQDLAETLEAFLSDRVSLLVVDNLEHLLAAAAALDALLAHCPGLTMLVTSREPLQLRREQIFEIHPLPVPGAQRATWTVEGLGAVPAVEFFVDRAQAAEVGFQLTETNATAIAELSRRLDGLPLAMELAAARTRLLQPAALLARVEHGLALLRWDTPDLLHRHRTMRATLDWSYALLSAEDQAVFRRLGVFAGGFTLEAVGAVATWDELGVEPLEVVQGLVDKHLVRVLENLAAVPRFGQLATVREYALELLVESGDEEVTRDRHLAHYLSLAEQADRSMRGPDEEAWLRRLDHEMDNLRLAQEWAISRGDTAAEWRLVAALALFWVLRGYLREGAARVDTARARAAEVDATLLARFREGAGMLAEWSGHDDHAVADYEASLAAAQVAGETAMAARVLGRLGYVAYAQSDVGRARSFIAEKLVLSRVAGSWPMIGLAFMYRVLMAIGPHGSAREQEQLRAELDEPVALLRQVGYGRSLSVLLAGRARLLVDVDAAAALAALREALELARERGDPLVMSVVPWIASVLLVERLPAEQVAQLGGAIAALEARSAAIGGRQMIDVFGPPQDRAVLTRVVAAARESLGEVTFAAADAAGRALAFEEVIEELLTALEDGAGVLATWTRDAAQSQQPASLLSPREREVLALVAEGRSNKEIAAALFIAPTTAKTHVASLFNKLGADTRARLVAVAAERGLL